MLTQPSKKTEFLFLSPVRGGSCPTKLLCNCVGLAKTVPFCIKNIVWKITNKNA